MKRVIAILFFYFLVIECFSQTGEEKIGISKYVKPGIMLGGFFNPTGEYVYILQQDSHVKEKKENRAGGVISLALIFPLNEKGEGKWKWDILLNVPIFDIKGNLTETKISNGLFNTQTPFGLGVGFFPFPKIPAIGFGVMANFLNQYKLRDEALKDRYFPIANYPTFDLQVTAPVPEAVLKPFLKKEPAITVSGGVIFRL